MNPVSPENSFSKGAVRSTILQLVFLNFTISHALSYPTNQTNYPPSIRKVGVHQVQHAPCASQPCLPWDSPSAQELQLELRIQLTFPQQLHAVIEKYSCLATSNVWSFNFITDPFGLLLTNDLCSVTGEKIK